jgi:hypothetical protein
VSGLGSSSSSSSGEALPVQPDSRRRVRHSVPIDQGLSIRKSRPPLISPVSSLVNITRLLRSNPGSPVPFSEPATPSPYSSPPNQHSSSSILPDFGAISDTLFWHLLLEKYWHIEEFPPGSLVSIVQNDLFSGAIQQTLIKIDQALRSPLHRRSIKSKTKSFFTMGYFSDSFPRVPLHDVTQRINLHLLRCAALLAYDQPEKGLKDAEAARRAAETEAVYYLQCKSQLYRGLCLRKLARWEEASAAFTRAANIRGWATRVEELKREAENMIVEQGMGQSRRSASGRQ